MLTPLFMAFQSFAANRMRTALTMLGTVIGVMSVLTLWSVGSGARLYMSGAVSSFGQNMLVVTPRFGADQESQQRYRYRPLNLEDVDGINHLCPSVSDTTPIRLDQSTVMYGDRHRTTRVVGCYPAWFRIRMWPLMQGNAFLDSDVRASSQVMVLGSLPAQELFGSINPVGQVVRMNGIPFRVVGVLEPKGSFFGDNQDDRVILPFTTMTEHLGADRHVHLILASARERELMPQSKTEILAAIRQTQRLPVDRKDSVEVQDLGDLSSSADSVMAGATILLGAIAAISLLVGGIGIMNIMLVSVSERTREIGLRIALGASDLQILMQFLYEALLLSLLGGVVGVLLGCGLAVAVSQMLSTLTGRDWPPVLDPLVIGATLFFTSAIGVFFGFYPAWRASRLDPIEALRHE